MVELNPVIKPTGISSGVNTFIIAQIVLLFCRWADVCDNWVFPMIVVWIVSCKLMPWKNTDLRMLFVIASSALTFFGNSVFLVPMALLNLAVDQGKLPEWISILVGDLASHINCLDIPIGFPIFGNNSYGIFEKVNEWLADFEIPLFYSVETEKLRSIDLNEARNDIADRLTLSEPKELSNCLRVAAQHRNLVTMVLFGLMSTLFGIVGITAYAAMALIYLATDDSGNSRIEYGNRGILVSDGIYLINTNLCGITIEHGIGTCLNGVLHVPYHVCRGMNIILNKSLLKPAYISANEDLVTYGGMPQFVQVRDNEELYINTERPDGRTTYRTVARVKDRQEMLTWASVTTPGESGSPVLVERDGKLQLVALAGRWVQSNPDDATEFARIYTPIEKPDVSKGVLQLIKHPGSGKTRNDLPNLVAQEMVNSKLSRILITGPTRVVCEELYDALQKKGFKVGLNIKTDNVRADRRARIQIAAHNTMLTLLEKSDPVVLHASMLIIDEAHFRDRATIMLREYARYLLEDGVKVVEMSATLDGVFDDGSNYTIQDHVVIEKEVPEMVIERLEMGERVLVFMPGLKGKFADNLKKRWKDYNPVILSRETFESGMLGIQDLDNRLILSTDIAECGINIQGLDSVFDFRLKFDYYLDGGVIAGDTRPINQASCVQRRGRVGRAGPGNYFYVDRPPSESLVDSATIDASICMTGRKWSSGVNNELGITLTDKQFRVVLDEGKPPTEVYLRYNGLGMLNHNCDDALQNWSNGNVEYAGCGRCGRDCRKKAKFYDERLHDWLVLNRPVVRINEI